MFKKFNLEGKLFVIFLLLLPTQLAYHFWPGFSYIYGIRVDFLAPALYLSDILFFCVFILWIFGDKRNFLKSLNIYKNVLLLACVILVANIIFSISLFETSYRSIKLIEFFCLAIYVRNRTLNIKTLIIKSLFYSSVFFSLIGIYQFIKGSTIGGPLYFLGERTFSLSTPGIALVNISGVDHLRAYSTFPHPNSFAGFLGAIMILSLISGILKRNLINIVCVSIISLAFLLTFSLNAYFGLLFILFLWILSKNNKMFKPAIYLFVLSAFFISLLLPFFAQPILIKTPTIVQNIGQRLDLAYISGLIISKHLLIGSGLGTFILNIPLYKGIYSYSWLLQPVHNLYLLIFSETGILGLILFFILIFKFIYRTLNKHNLYIILAFVFILFTGLFDHYTLTLQQNFLLMAIIVGIG